MQKIFFVFSVLGTYHKNLLDDLLLYINPITKKSNNLRKFGYIEEK